MATRSLLASRLLRRCSTRSSASSPSAGARLYRDDVSSCQSLPYSNMQIAFVFQSGGVDFYKGTASSKSFFNNEHRFNNRSGSQLTRPLGPSVICKQHLNPVCSNSSMVPQRKFTSKSKDDEHIYDDVEARLMGDDGNSREGMYMEDNSADGMAGTNFDNYDGENLYGGESSWARGEESVGELSEGESEESEEEAGSAGDPSDEEFEGERTDEELDELLENTPLFEPPEPGGPGEMDPEFSFRPEGPVHYPGMEYDPEELDVTRPLPRRRREPRPKEVITVQEVIDKADFRNVRYLTKFISETGNIIARKEFNMRNKSHGRITKAIKTARFFGLMPYTNMGRPKYVFNEPFDEFSEFDETDDERNVQDQQEGTNYDGRRSGSFERFRPRAGGYFYGQGTGRM